MSNTARYYVLTFLAAALVGALWGTLLGGVLEAFIGAFIGAFGAVVIVALSGPRIRGILSSTYNMPFSSGAGRRNTRDD